MSHYIKIYEDALPLEFCQKLIAKFDRDARVKPDPQPDYSTRKYLNISQQSDWAAVGHELMAYADRLTREYFALPDAMESVRQTDWFDDGYVLSRYDVGDTCILHVDGQCPVPPQNGLRLATQLFYLNTVEDGGETFFPLQNVRIQPKAGRGVMFPPGLTHPHEVLAAGQKRYILQTWIIDPELVVYHIDELGAI